MNSFICKPKSPIRNLVKNYSAIACEPRKLPRYLTKYNSEISETDVIRKSFLDFFIQQEHKYVDPCSVLSKTQGLYFTNSGVSQFQDHILSGKNENHTIFNNISRAVNSQRCIRLGGNQCDWKSIGHDPIHLSSFEMLGNWSFRDYGKEQACYLMWHYLTEILKLPPSHLYVTYFGGCKELGIPPDDATREIWFNLGVKDSKILQFGIDANFWEMGDRKHDVLCGVSTEIHWDYLATFTDGDSKEARCARCFVNSNSPEVVELWNCVFMQYKWSKNGTQLTNLPGLIVDTGMGLERLASVMQGVSSVYDIDTFQNIMNRISYISGATKYEGNFNLDYKRLFSPRLPSKFTEIDNKLNVIVKKDIAYRIICDHMRTLCIAIYDGIKPGRQDVAGKVRQLLQRSVRQAVNVLDMHGQLYELVDVVCDSLFNQIDFSPKMRNKLKEIIRSEEIKFLKIHGKQEGAFRKFIDSRNSDSKEISVTEKEDINTGKYGVPISFNLIEAIAADYNMSVSNDYFTPNDADNESTKTPMPKIQNNKDYQNYLEESGLELTDLNPIYQYHFDKVTEKFIVNDVSTSILDIVLLEVEGQYRVGIITSESNMFPHYKGGQQSDCGWITVTTDESSDQPVFKLEIEYVEECKPGYLIHWAKLEKSNDIDVYRKLPGKKAIIQVDADRRTGNTVHHTAQHVVFGALNKIFNRVISISKKVDSSSANITFSVDTEFGDIGPLANPQLAELIEKECRQLIDQNAEIGLMTSIGLENLKEMKNEENFRISMLENRLPSSVRIVDVPGNKEPCCGTHCFNMRELKDIVISALRCTRQTKTELVLVAGQNALDIRANELKLKEIYKQVDSDEVATKDEHKALVSQLSTIKMSRYNSSKTFRYLIFDKVNMVNRFKVNVEKALGKLLKDAQERSSENNENVWTFNMDIDSTKKTIDVVLQNHIDRPLIIYDKRSILVYLPQNLESMKRTEIMKKLMDKCKHFEQSKPSLRGPNNNTDDLFLLLIHLNRDSEAIKSETSNIQQIILSEIGS